METLGVLVLVFLGWMALRFFLSVGARTATAAVRTATGKGSFSENMEVAFTGLGDFQVRVIDKRMGENEDGPLGKVIEVRGVFPLVARVNLAASVSIFDTTEDELKFVLSNLEMFQEPETIIYQHVTEIGEVGPDQGFVKWTAVGCVFTETISVPKQGDREGSHPSTHKRLPL